MPLVRRILVTLAVCLLLNRCMPAQAAGWSADIVGTYAIASFPQCTWWVWSNRADLEAVTYGPAAWWGWEAAQAGYRVRATPVVGAVAVLQPWTAGAWGEGHVSYVEAVSGSYAFVSELNWQPFPTIPHRRWLHIQRGLTFIWPSR